MSLVLIDQNETDIFENCKHKSCDLRYYEILKFKKRNYISYILQLKLILNFNEFLYQFMQ